MTHKLKILEDFANAICNGEKTFEIRENDRGYQRGDQIWFAATTKSGLIIEDHAINKHTYQITYVLSGWGIEQGYVALAIKRVK